MLNVEKSANEFFAKFAEQKPAAAKKMTDDLAKFETEDLIGCLRSAPNRAQNVTHLLVLTRVLTYMIFARNDEASKRFRIEMQKAEALVDSILDDSPCDCPKCTAAREGLH